MARTAGFLIGPFGGGGGLFRQHPVCTYIYTHIHRSLFVLYSRKTYLYSFSLLPSLHRPCLQLPWCSALFCGVHMPTEGGDGNFCQSAMESFRPLCLQNLTIQLCLLTEMPFRSSSLSSCLSQVPCFRISVLVIFDESRQQNPNAPLLTSRT